ncbi:acyl-CoA carboxylase subunit epsilon [Rhizocola hellebori]|uniref:acyl-CoA carboxylase subunit epsilon n=1 Tax=Rhizocola hellebori TaxID=1392758 RepID=UPI001940B986|nr:acyl-CoA carboxylase subunit epsilon [Rhizocola hellebori]
MNLRIDRGSPTPEEIAALIGVIVSLPSSTSEPAQQPSLWWRSGLPVTRAGWRESGLTRPS